MTIILARFMPLIRTFAPFVACVAQMDRIRFTTYNVLGAVLWVASLTLAGYLFGNLIWVQHNLSRLIWALVLVPGLLVCGRRLESATRKPAWGQRRVVTRT